MPVVNSHSVELFPQVSRAPAIPVRIEVLELTARRCGMEITCSQPLKLFTEIRMVIRTDAREFEIHTMVVGCRQIWDNRWKISLYFLNVAGRAPEVRALAV